MQTAQFRYHPLLENMVSMVHDPLILSVCWLATDQKRPEPMLARVHVMGQVSATSGFRFEEQELQQSFELSHITAWKV